MLDFYGTSDSQPQGTTTGRMSTSNPGLNAIPRHANELSRFTRLSKVSTDRAGSSEVEYDMVALRDSDGYLLFTVIHKGKEIGSFYAGRDNGNMDTRKSLLKFLFNNMPLIPFDGVYMTYRFTLKDGRQCAIVGSLFTTAMQKQMAEKGIDKVLFRAEPFLTSVVVTERTGDIAYRRKTWETTDQALDYGQSLRAFFFAHPEYVDTYMTGEEEDLVEFIDSHWGDNSGMDETPILLAAEHTKSVMERLSFGFIEEEAE